MMGAQNAHSSLNLALASSGDPLVGSIPASGFADVVLVVLRLPHYGAPAGAPALE